jgi:hypothetical protein
MFFRAELRLEIDSRQSPVALIRPPQFQAELHPATLLRYVTRLFCSDAEVRLSGRSNVMIF